MHFIWFFPICYQWYKEFCHCLVHCDYFLFFSCYPSPVKWYKNICYKIHCLFFLFQPSVISGSKTRLQVSFDQIFNPIHSSQKVENCSSQNCQCQIRPPTTAWRQWPALANLEIMKGHFRPPLGQAKDLSSMSDQEVRFVGIFSFNNNDNLYCRRKHKNMYLHRNLVW